MTNNKCVRKKLKIVSSMSRKVCFSMMYPSTLPRTEKAIQKELHGDFPGGLVVKIPPSNVGDRGLTPDRGTKIPLAWDN